MYGESYVIGVKNMLSLSYRVGSYNVKIFIVLS